MKIAVSCVERRAVLPQRRGRGTKTALPRQGLIDFPKVRQPARFTLSSRIFSTIAVAFSITWTGMNSKRPW